MNVVWSGHNLLGEGPLWDASRESFLWVDILAHQIHILHVPTQQHRMFQFDDFISSINLTSSGRYIVTCRHTVEFFDSETGELTPWIAPLKGQTDVRFNDVKVDPQGRLWAGFMDLSESNPIGGLMRIDGSGEATLMVKNITIANGMAWNKACDTFYHTDSPARTIYQYDFDAKAGTVKNQRVFAKIPDERGYPDGLTIDSEDCIWGAHWDGWCITRYRPDGSIDKVIDVPVQRATSCTFGGKDLTTLYITSAAIKLSKADLEKGPDAGSVLSLDTGVKGVESVGFVVTP